MFPISFVAVMDILASEKIDLLVVEVLRVLWRSDSHLQLMLIVWMRSLMRSCCLSVVLEEEVTKEVSIVLLSWIIAGTEVAILATVFFLSAS